MAVYAEYEKRETGNVTSAAFHEKSEKNFNLDTQVVFYYLIYYYNLFFMSRYERMDCIKRSMMPVEALFFTSPEPVDKKRKKQAEEA